MDILTLTVSILSFLAATGSALYARHALVFSESATRTADASLRFQVLVPALAEYRSARMFVAIRHLWDFYKVNPSTLVERFQWQYEADRKAEEKLEGDELLAHVEVSLDFHRRQVTHFYNMLTSVYDEGGLQRKWLYTYWHRRELRIIPDILVPIERALAVSIDAPVARVTIDRLTQMYEDCAV